MIKLFRNIRQNLLAEGKTSRYLKYAIGEIILVVIGILIALQINNWNEGNKNQQLEQNFYSNVLDDLNDDNKKLDDQVVFYTNRIENLGWLLKKVKNPDLDINPKEFGKRVEPLYYTNEAISYSATYEASKSSGIFDNFKNKTLLKNITQYYSNFQTIQQVSASTSQIVIDQFEPIMATIPENFIGIESNDFVITSEKYNNNEYYEFLSSIEDTRNLTIDFKSFFKAPVFENYIIGDLGRSFNALSVIAQRKTRTSQIAKEIKAYLND